MLYVNVGSSFKYLASVLAGLKAWVALPDSNHWVSPTVGLIFESGANAPGSIDTLKFHVIN